MPTTLRFDGPRILLDGQPNLVIGGDFQYFRIPPALWRPSLEKLRDAGLRSIAIYIPWIYHELQEGAFDFDGHTEAGRDLLSFLAHCDALDLAVVAKPGPYIYAEYPGFGVPEWLRENYPEQLMQVGRRQSYPQPALNHPGYLAHVKRWLFAIAGVLRPFVASGRVVAIQIDNETGYPQFLQGPNVIDRNPEALALFREAIAERFASVREFNLVWGTRFASFEEVEPPSEAAFNASQWDTMARYVEDYVANYLANLKAIWEEIGLDTFYYLNDIWLDFWPSNLVKKNKVAPVAFDLYPRHSDLPVTLDQPYGVAYVPRLFGAFLKDGPLMAAELGCGWLDPACTVAPEATWQSTMASFAHGVQAVYYYTVMDGRDPEGDYVYRPLLDMAGEATSRMPVAEAVGRFCREWGPYVAATDDARSPVAVLHHAAISREIMSASFAPLSSAVSKSHRAIDEAMTIVSVNAGLYGALAEAGYTPRVLNLEAATPEELAAHGAIFFNSIGSLDPAHQQKLLAYVKQGGTLVTLGAPFAEDSRLFPARVLAIKNPQAVLTMARIGWDMVKLFWRSARHFGHRLSAYAVQGMYPAMLLTKHAARTGLWLKEPRTGRRLWASRFVTTSKLRAGVSALLSFGGQAAAYETTVDAGRSVFIGTLLGALFDSPGYYLDEASRKRSVVDFLGRFLGERGVAPLYDPVSELELVMREGEGIRIAFLFNRGPAREFELRPGVDAGWRLADQFAAYGSRADWAAGRLTGRLAKDDVLVLRWEPAT